jgi:DNA replication protein DnaC
MKSNLVHAQFGYVEFKKKCECDDCHVKFQGHLHRYMLGNTTRERIDHYCPSCQAKRDLLEEEQEKQAILEQAASTRRRWRETCGIPYHFMNKDFSAWDKSRVPPAYNLAVKYAEQFPIDKSSVGYPSLLMFSKAYGVGKTHLAVSIGHRVFDRSACFDGTNPVMFITETDIMLRIRATYDRDYVGDSERAIYGSLKGKSLLILDDVGKEQPQDPKFMQRVYFHVIDGRYQRRLPMVITSNLDLDELFEHVGGAAADRIFEMAGANIVELKGQSYRRRPAKESAK